MRYFKITSVVSHTHTSHNILIAVVVSMPPSHHRWGEGERRETGEGEGKEGRREKIDCSKYAENPIVNSILQATPPTHSSETDRKIVT